jgi:mannose-6-phosphate isomerase-like protein (cupin superfamily)
MIKKFTDFPTYTDPGAINQVCRDILAKNSGEAESLQIGICEITGPGKVAEDSHEKWTQYFLVTDGKGTLHLGEKSIPIAKNMLVEIPKNTPHYAECGEGSRLRYFFINIHDAK